MTEVQRKTVLVDGLATGYLEAGQGDPVVLLHGGEFGINAELGWENNITALAAHHRVLALDMLGFGESAKVVDFNDGRGMRIRHLARFCQAVGVESAQIHRNEFSASLYDYNATVAGMRRIVEALFHDPSYPADNTYLQRRYESSIAPGAWEALAAARFRRPGLDPPSPPSSARPYERIAVPTLVVEGECDKLLPPGWAADIAGRIRGGRSAVIGKAGHCPQIEQPSAANDLLLDFLAEVQRKVSA